MATSSAARAPRRGPGPAADLATVVYSSRAVQPFTDPELQSLMHAAQARNHQEGVTGVVLYDECRFFQWLEGPAPGVERIMGSIRNDRRHTDLQVITERASDARRFDGWDMKLAAPGADPAVWNDDILDPPADVLEDLRRQPAAAPTLLVKLVPPPAAERESPLAASLKGTTLSPATARILKDAILQKVIPRLLHSHIPPDLAQAPVSPRAAELAELLVATDQAASMALIQELRGNRGDPRQLFAPLLEPAARSLGDMWQEDLVNEFEVTLGLCRLQSAVRLLGAGLPRTVLTSRQPKVMIAPVPGELHQLVAALDSEWLWREGWSPQSEYPENDRSLADLLSATWVDILDLSLSPSFRRMDSLPRLARTIALARRASLNPNVVVLVGGRAFVEDQAIGLDVGADLSSRSSAHVDRLMLQGWQTETDEA